MTDKRDIASAFRNFADRLLAASHEVGGLQLAAGLILCEADRIEAADD